MKAPIKAILFGAIGAIVGLLLLGIFLGAREWNPGPGPEGEYNAKLNIETKNVADGRDKAKVIIEKGHQGQLENEDFDLPSKALGIFPRSAEAVMTFRVPAAQFDAALASLDTAGVGTVVDQEINGRDDIERRGELTEIAQILNERMTTTPTTDGDKQALEAQERLQELADTSNFPVIVVEIHPGRGALGWIAWFIVNRVVWVALGILLFWVWTRRKSEPKISPVIGPADEDERQNSPERNPGVQDRGATT